MNHAEMVGSASQYIAFVAPGVSWVLVLASGTTHVIHALLPISEIPWPSDSRP